MATNETSTQIKTKQYDPIINFFMISPRTWRDSGNSLVILFEDFLKLYLILEYLVFMCKKQEIFNEENGYK